MFDDTAQTTALEDVHTFFITACYKQSTKSVRIQVKVKEEKEVLLIAIIKDEASIIIRKKGVNKTMRKK